MREQPDENIESHEFSEKEIYVLEEIRKLLEEIRKLLNSGLILFLLGINAGLLIALFVVTL